VSPDVPVGDVADTTTTLDSTPGRPVLVRRDDHWHDGELRAWRRDLDGWRGFVCHAESAGLRWLEWVSAEGVRLA
jgi:hypothetical protein